MTKVNGEESASHTGGDKSKRKVVVTLPQEEDEDDDSKRNRVAEPTFACTDPEAFIMLTGQGDEVRCSIVKLAGNLNFPLTV